MAIGLFGQRLDPVRTYNFLVTLADASNVAGTLLSGVQNTLLGGFSECSGLSMELKTEDYNEGGNNGTVRKFPTRVSYGTIHLKRGAALNDELWKWHYSFVEGKGKRRDGIIMLQDDQHVPVKIWTFRRGLPVKWTGPSMNAMESHAAIEELEIAHEGLGTHTPGSIVGGIVGAIF
jgi:phage tail-like protein